MKSSESRQLRFVFADNPQGSEDTRKADESAGRSFLLHQAALKETHETDASTEGQGNRPDHLLEQVASMPNLARALLHVARNKGAAGVDGRSAAQVVESAPDLLPPLRQALITGTYLPGDIRRVWIPKPGGGERGLGIPTVAA